MRGLNLVLHTSLSPSPYLAVANMADSCKAVLQKRKKVIVAMTGATGAILGIKTLIALRRLNVETHLVMSKWAESTIKYETDYTPQNTRALADFTYGNHDMASRIASGSYRCDGMIVVPCSMKSLAAINAGYCDDLISRAADVVLKERRKLVLVARECPLSGIHLQNMLSLSQNGAIIFPPVPAFYNRPSSLDNVVDHTVQEDDEWWYDGSDSILMHGGGNGQTVHADWKAGLSLNIISTIEYAIRAASQAIALMEEARKYAMIATYGYLEGEYAFSATLLLIMADAAFSTPHMLKSTITEGLGVLEWMANRGNIYIDTKRRLLLDLRATLKLQIAPQNADHQEDSGASDNSTLDETGNVFDGASNDVSTTMPNNGGSSSLFQSFDFNFADDPALWEEVINYTDINTDSMINSLI
ncbi:hypothetical protein HJFPF1_02298 [Paramyrothecium foliicola]|nr:hypothetical protein HJFPF1_02298 [Paramyrothecium foliicola]